MKIKKNIMIAGICVMILGTSACANKEGNVLDDPNQAETQPSVSQPLETEDNVQIKDSETEMTAENNTEGQVNDDLALEEELKQYRQERDDNVIEENGLVEGGSPDEENYTFDLSGTSHTSQFDTRETTEAYSVARKYVTDTLGIKPITKMPVYMCVDPRILSIYEEEDKGVANGYDNNNIFVCEYCKEDGTWQYLILVREGKGEAWKVIHNGSSYKE